MSDNDALRIIPADDGKVLTKDQKRFNSLLSQIAQARTKLAAWQENLLQFGIAHAQVVAPLETQLRSTRRQWIFTLQALLDEHRGWSQAQRETLIDLVREAAGELLNDDDEDMELKALFALHADLDFNAERQQRLHALKDLAESMTGLDLGDEADITDQEDLLRRLHQGLHRQQAAADTQREAQTPKRRKTAAQQRREDEAQQATQSIREVWRKLASALHPDRETDPVRREAKTALMQKVNHAYEKNDLLALLELQLHIEQVDAGHMAQADAQRVKHYNKVLTEQLDDIRGAVWRVEAEFRMDFGLEHERSLQPRQLGLLVQKLARQVQAGQAQLQAEMGLFRDQAATKRWLRIQRQALREAASEMDFF